MVLHVETLYGCSNPSFFADGPNDKPTSITSGAWGPMLPLLALMASTSSPEPASGLSSFTFRPYFCLNPLMTSPYPHQSCGSAITVSWPSCLAAATSWFMPVCPDATGTNARTTSAANETMRVHMRFCAIRSPLWNRNTSHRSGMLKEYRMGVGNSLWCATIGRKRHRSTLPLPATAPPRGPGPPASCAAPGAPTAAPENSPHHAPAFEVHAPRCARPLPRSV